MFCDEYKLIGVTKTVYYYNLTIWSPHTVNKRLSITSMSTTQIYS